MKSLTRLASVITLFSIFMLPALTVSAKDVTLDGATVKGPTSDIKVTYALNKTEKIARVKEVRDVSATGSRSTCVIPSKIKVSGTTYKVTKIGKAAFGYENFDKVVLPNTINEICDDAFSNVQFLSNCEIPTSVKKIGRNAFANNMLTKVTIPAACTSIGDGAFAYNEIHQLKFSDTSTPLAIGANAFKNNRLGPSALVLPARITSIGQGAFACNDQLQSVTINCNVSGIPVQCFYSCVRLTSVNINSNIQTIGESAFADCPFLTNFRLATQSLRVIGKNAFADCDLNSLDDTFLVYGLSVIGDGAFRGNSWLSTIKLPITITSIGNNAFAGDDRIAEISCVSLHVPQLADNAFSNNVYHNCRVIVSGDLLAAFRSAAGWRNFSWFLDAGVDDVTVDHPENSPMYFNLRGEPVGTPYIPGVYIELSNGRTRKIIIR